MMSQEKTLQMSISGPCLEMAEPDPQGWEAVYGTGAVQQIAPGKAMLIAGRRVVGEAIIDFSDGADAYIIDSLESVGQQHPISLARNGTAVHPETGQSLITVAFLLTGGFIPAETVLADGTPHPAAGTGFVWITYHGIPADLSQHLPAGNDAYVRQELVQLKYVDGTVRITDRQMLANDEMLDGYEFLNRPLNNAIPDGLDLLSGVVCGPADTTLADPMIPINHPRTHPRFGRNFGCGLCRWRYCDQKWQPVKVVNVSGSDMSFEPSLVRDQDGALLMTVRGLGLKEPPGAVHEGLENTYEHFRVYRSTDNGQTWQSVIHLPRMRNATPVVLNKAVDGTLFLAANPYQSGCDSQGRRIPSTRYRDKLSLWPLTDDRQGLGKEVCVLDANEILGSPRVVESDHQSHDNIWLLDHPVANIVNLADGRDHCLLCFRVTDVGVNASGLRPAPKAGLWLEEITTTG